MSWSLQDTLDPRADYEREEWRRTRATFHEMFQLWVYETVCKAPDRYGCVRVNTVCHVAGGKFNLPLLNMNGEDMKNWKLNFSWPDWDLQSSMLLFKRIKIALASLACVVSSVDWFMSLGTAPHVWMLVESVPLVTRLFCLQILKRFPQNGEKRWMSVSEMKMEQRALTVVIVQS